MLTFIVGVVLLSMVFLASAGLATAAYGLFTSASSLVQNWHAWYAKYWMIRSAARRVAEVRGLGNSIRRDMEELSMEYLDDISQMEGR